MKSSLLRNNIFLLDGLGAVVTAILLSQILGRFTDFFGVGKTYLSLLASIAPVFAVYSIANHFFIHRSRLWKRNLKAIAIANLIYCVVTGSMLIYLSDRITLFGWLYFLGEILIILLLVRVELRIAHQVD